MLPGALLVKGRLHERIRVHICRQKPHQPSQKDSETWTSPSTASRKIFYATSSSMSVARTYLHARVYRAKPQWFNISYVCHVWRQAALSFSVLWDTPELLNPVLAVEMVWRHLCYYLHWSDELPSFFCEQMLSLVKRSGATITGHGKTFSSVLFHRYNP